MCAHSQTQLLRPPDKFSRNAFGSSVSLDKSTLSTAIVGCPNCNATKNAGQIFVFDSSQPGRAWSQQQVLVADVFDFNRDPLRITYFLGDAVMVDDNVLLGRGLRFNGIEGVLGVVVFVRDTVSRVWSQQQVLQLTHDVESFDLDDDTIVLATPSQKVNSGTGIDGAGAVHVLYPNSKEFSASGWSTLATSVMPTRGLQWSNRQILFSPESRRNGNFGSDISLLGNTLIVGEQGTSSIHVFNRGTSAGKWSSTQTLHGSVPMKFFSDNYLYGSSLLTVGFPVTNGVPFQPSIELFAQDIDWKCLVLTLEDAWGDGWGGAQLLVETPTGDKDTFSAHCNYPNPLSFRYCPLQSSDSGVYTLSLDKASVENEYFWEISWKVLDESTNTIFTGNLATVMKFTFNTTLLAFTSSNIVNALPTPAPCTLCQATARGEGMSEIYLSMHSEVGSSWYDDTYRGTKYFLSDTNGHKLIQSGGMCDVLSEASTSECQFNLPDGTYALRVASDLNGNAAGNTWSFCGLTGSSDSLHIVFDLRSSVCTPLVVYTLDAYCSADLQAVGMVEGVLEVTVPGVSAGISSKGVDRAQVAYALSDQDASVSVKDISVTAISSQASRIIVSFTVTMNSAKTTYAAQNYDALQDMLDSVAESVQAGVLSGSVLTALRDNSRVPSSTLFSAATNVKLLTIEVRDRIDLVQTVPSPVDYSFSDHA